MLPLASQLLPAGTGQGTAAYTDFAGLAALRAAAGRDAAGTLEAVAKQFESVFVHMMLKSMRDTTGGDTLLGSGGKLFTDLYDHQLALSVSASKTFGLAEMLVQQLSPQTRQASSQVPAESAASRTLSGAAEPASSSSPAAGPPIRPPLSGRKAATTPVPNGPGLADSRLGTALGVRQTDTVAATTMSALHSRRSFIQSIWKHAQSAAASLGVNPRVLVAQAVLETGWGRSVMPDSKGRSSHNLFGIKADGRWSGSKVEVSTLEYVNGLLNRVRAPFRAYASVAESFSDYADFIRGQPRYAEAMSNAADPERYVRSLQAAGYATDPHYADKILSIYARPELNDVIDELELREVKTDDD